LETITTKTSGLAALSFLDMCCDDMTMLPDIIFLDISMPLIDGFSFLHKFAGYPEAVKNKCKIIMLTSSQNLDDEIRAKIGLHVSKFLRKPLTNYTIEQIFK
jgi:CheY-like chemotaxis protein